MVDDESTRLESLPEDVRGPSDAGDPIDPEGDDLPPTLDGFRPPGTSDRTLEAEAPASLTETTGVEASEAREARDSASATLEPMSGTGSAAGPSTAPTAPAMSASSSAPVDTGDAVDAPAAVDATDLRAGDGGTEPVARNSWPALDDPSEAPILDPLAARDRTRDIMHAFTARDAADVLDALDADAALAALGTRRSPAGAGGAPAVSPSAEGAAASPARTGVLRQMRHLMGHALRVRGGADAGKVVRKCGYLIAGTRPGRVGAGLAVAALIAMGVHHHRVDRAAGQLQRETAVAFLSLPRDLRTAAVTAHRSTDYLDGVERAEREVLDRAWQLAPDDPAARLAILDQQVRWVTRHRAEPATATLAAAILRRLEAIPGSDRDQVGINARLLATQLLVAGIAPTATGEVAAVRHRFAERIVGYQGQLADGKFHPVAGDPWSPAMQAALHRAIVEASQRPSRGSAEWRAGYQETTSRMLDVQRVLPTFHTVAEANAFEAKAADVERAARQGHRTRAPR